MKVLKSISNKILDMIEIYMPMGTFIIMFIFYIVMIAYRYIFYKQVRSIFELSIILFLWSSMLAASYGGRADKHIVFTILYDKVSEKTKLLFRIAGNLFIAITFIILVPFTYESIQFMAIKKSSILKIPYNIVFFPFLIFVILTLLHYSISIIKDIKLISKSSKMTDQN